MIESIVSFLAEAVIPFLGPAIPYILVIIKILVVVTILLVGTGLLTVAERKIMWRMQIRYGPMRVGWHGWLQWLADGIKLVGKEFIIPAAVDKPLFLLAPLITFVFAIIPWVAVPWGPPPNYVITDMNVGLLFILAIGSLDIYGIVLAGWASNCKYSLLGALRGAAQMISYEIPLILALIGSCMLAGSMSMVKIVEAQAQQGIWYIFLQPVAFICYLIAGLSETQRIPFDMLEDDAALVTGFFTEYSGIAFSLFSMGEYFVMLMIGAVSSTLFMGGWLRPFPSVEALAFLDIVPPMFWFAGKTLLFIFLAIWLRATLPRVRYDQLMYLGWKVLIPLTILNILLVGIYKMVDFSGMKILIYYGLTFFAAAMAMKACSKYFYGTLGPYGYKAETPLEADRHLGASNEFTPSDKLRTIS
jgi:NADH-quinone oxidoreductase subunit H